jgi:hypothetical protein
MSREDVTESNAQLISASCTSGWTDWIWGELWLLPEGLLRLSLGRQGTTAFATPELSGKSFGPTVDPLSLPQSQIETEAIPDLLAKSRHNRWIPRDQITSATLRNGLLNGRLRVELVDGSQIKLLWLKRDPAYEVLRSTLSEWLGDRFKLQ